MPYISDAPAALLRDVERVGGRELHPRGQFVAGDPGVEVGLAGPVALVDLVEPAEQVALGRRRPRRAGRRPGFRFSTGEPVERKRVPWKSGGRNPACQFSTPLTGRPSGSSSTT